MRISDFEKKIIPQVILKFDPIAKIYLFGSRTQDHEKGGDIDILIISDKLGFADKIKIKSALFNYLEEQKIDIIIKQPFDEDAFVKTIQDDLIPL